jgi:hypothetical protein
MSYKEEYSYAENMDDDLLDEGIMVYNPKGDHVDDDSSFSTVSTNRKKRRKLFEDLKKVDKGYHKLERRDGFKKFSIEVYSSVMTPGSMIRDAVTGYKHSEHRIGTLNEHLYFKVKIATGEMPDAGSLFFDSPEQFERHFKTEVNQQIKEQWTNKCAEIRARNRQST